MHQRNVLINIFTIKKSHKCNVDFIGDKQLNVYTTDTSVEQNVQTYKYQLYTPYTTDDTSIYT